MGTFHYAAQKTMLLPPFLYRQNYTTSFKNYAAPPKKFAAQRNYTTI